MITSAPPAAGISSEEFRDVIGRFASGVTVVTTVDCGRAWGTTASSVTSLSLTPPMLLVCINQQSATGRAMASAGVFGVNILAEHQDALARRFASKDPDKFRDVAVSEGVYGVPLVDGALAQLECRVVERVRAGTHTIFLAEVDFAFGSEGAPLAYFRGRFGGLRL